MMPVEQHDYGASCTLDRILENERLRDTKYSGPRQKRLKIAIGRGKIFHASAGFLKMLCEKYGPNTPFSEALAKWEGR